MKMVETYQKRKEYGGVVLYRKSDNESLSDVVAGGGAWFAIDSRRLSAPIRRMLRDVM